MNTFGGFFDFFGGDSDTDSSGTAGSYTLPPTTDPFGWSSWLGGGQSTDVVGGVSDSQLNDWNTYWASGGVMNANLGGTQSGTASSSDIFSGIGDFFSGLTQNLPGLIQTGLGAYAQVQQLIASQNPQDELVRLPGSNTPVIKRTQGGQTSYYPITDLYPSLAPQVQQAQRSQNWLLPVALVGILGIGFILISKKK